MNKNQDEATKLQTVQIVRQGETLFWFLFIHYTLDGAALCRINYWMWLN